MQKINLLLFGCFLTAISASAQSFISGKVVDSNNQPQPYISVLFLNPNDSVYINGGVTDGDGKFSVAEKNSGNYLLNIKSMGNVPYYKPVALNNKNVDLGTMMLTADSKTLKEVSVIGTKKLIEFNGDKMVMDLSVSPITSGLNALELLGKVPGVSVNIQSETIQIAGKTGVMVMIDGRPTNMTGTELAAMLKSMKSDEFEKVEVITNPSAKYDAQGTSGIINLKTKSGKVYGTNYSIRLGGGYSHYAKFGTYPKYNEGFSVNIKRKKITANLNLNHSHGTDFVSINESRFFLDNEKSMLTKQYTTELDKGHNNYYSGRLNVDFYLFKKTTFGISASCALFDGNKKSNLEQIINDGADVNIRTINTDKRRSDDPFFSRLNAHLKHTFDTLGTELSLDLDALLNHLDTRRQFYGNEFSTNANQNSFHSITTIQDPKTYVVSLSFEKQLNKKTHLETGYKSRITLIKSNFTSDFSDIDSLKHSVFNFLENVNAAYLIFKRELGSKMNLEAGIRAEHTYSLGTNEAGNKLSSQNYINLFPSFSLNKKFDAYSMSLGYSRRIGRQDVATFNTFKRFETPLLYEQGNPNVVASLNNSYNLSTTIKDKYFIELGYISLKNNITQILEVDTTFIPGYHLTRSGVGNTKGKTSWWMLKGYIPISVTKLWTINIQIDGGFNDYNYTLNEARVKTIQLFWGGSCQQNFSITETFSAEINAWVNSGETSGFETNKAMGAIDFGFSKKIFKKNGSLRLSIQDPFNFNNYKATLNNDYLKGTGYYKWDNRSIQLDFTYNFGNRNVNVNPWQSKFKEADAERKN